MGLNAQSNNKNWGTRVNQTAMMEIYDHPEINEFSTTNSPSVEYPSNHFNPYEDSDIGDSLRETRDMGKMATKFSPWKVAKAAAAISISTIGAVSLISSINSARPEFEAPTLQILHGEGYSLTYEFSLTVRKSVTCFFDLSVDGHKEEEQAYKLDYSSEEAVVIDSSKKRFDLSGVFENLREGNYTFRIYCQFGYGKSSIYSHQGRIGEAL